MDVSGHAVVIAGAGPTGLMLSGELALAGVDVAIVERRPTQELAGARAGGLHARTIEVLDQRGIADRFLSQGTEAQVAGFAQDDAGVDVELSEGGPLQAEYLVGCDGGRSLIRKTAGIEFAGWDATTSCIIDEVEMAEEPQWGLGRDSRGPYGISRMEGGGPIRVLVTEEHVGPAGDPTLADLSEALIAVYGSDYGVHSPTWISRFSDMARQATTYRKGRVLLAGDAAHVHSPAGGQGLNIGVQDAVNLGWKLAQVVNRTSPDSLLD